MRGPGRPARGRDTQRGVALILVLWGVVLLSSIAVGYAYTVRTEARIARNELERERALALAEAGVSRALAALMTRERSSSERVARQGGFSLAGGTVTWRVDDATGRVALNHASAALLDRLLEGIGVGAQARPGLVDAVLDWRDSDRLHRLDGAEDQEYRHAGRDHGSADRPFVSVDELQQVLGMSPPIVARLAPLLIVQGRHRGVNPHHASAALLLVLGAGSEEQVDAFLAARDRWMGSAGPPFTRWLGGSPFLTSETGPVRVISATGRTPGGARVDLQVVVDTDAQRWNIVDWRRIPAGEGDHGDR